MELIRHLFVGFFILSQLHLGNSILLACYFTNWAQYRDGASRFTVDDVDPYLCTHLIYAFAAIDERYQIISTEDNDEDSYKIFNNLKLQNHKLKTLLSVGGWIFGSARYNNVVSTQTTRRAFIKSVISFLRIHRFDGIDLAWHYPGAKGNPAENKNLYTRLIEEMKIAFIEEATDTQQYELMLVASMSAGKQIIDDSYEVNIISQYLDFIIVMSFDFHGPWNVFIGHHSPLSQNKGEHGELQFLNVEYAVKYYRSQGSPGKKLLVGFGTYGRSFKLQTDSWRIGAPANGPGPKGRYTNQPGTMAYYEICEFLKGADKHWNSIQKVPFAVKEGVWIGYDNMRSIDVKVKWLRAERFGGAAVWTLDFDDIMGSCKQGFSPLVTRLKMQLSVASGLQLETLAMKAFLAMMAIIQTA
ncbi:acidic mammalian chitinase-like [Leucoraja erinacea]|uniref:acidic mammalian chitinase-like n=1 Tax=Leucoraja erinaceus TaxID=7782 RepID=UPI002456A43B|nr:acidic mammalian chitinase-like [Leucoraja erinacea]